MNIFVIGCGSIGERHISNLKKFHPNFRVIVTDTSAERLSLMQKKYDVTICKTLEEGFKKPIDAAVICTPPSSHISIALRAVEKNAHVFIEKPLSHTLHGVEELIEKAHSANLVTFVGYCFRFHPGLERVKKFLDSGELGNVVLAQAEYGQYLPDWRPWQDYSQSYTAKKGLGGGIILDGSHEIDYIRWLVGDVKEVASFTGESHELKVETESAAGIILKFLQGAIGIVHVDFLRRDYSRSCEIICRNGTIKWSYQDNFVKIYRQREQKWRVYDNIDRDSNNMYVAEMNHFIGCILGKESPLVSGQEGLKTLKIALAAKESAQKGVIIKL